MEKLACIYLKKKQKHIPNRNFWKSSNVNFSGVTLSLGRVTYWICYCHKAHSITLPETNIAPENAWLELVSFLEGLFSGAKPLLVSGRVTFEGNESHRLCTPNLPKIHTFQLRFCWPNLLRMCCNSCHSQRAVWPRWLANCWKSSKPQRVEWSCENRRHWAWFFQDTFI